MSLPREEERGLLRALERKEATALIGPRRCGKSTLALRLLDALQARGWNSAYWDFEALNAPRSAAELAAAVRRTPKDCFVVLDEVQAVPGWVRAVRDLIERDARRLLITGSSASLLSAEVASSLAGRAVPQTILPLSYRDAQVWGLKTLDAYARTGGYPECVLQTSRAPELHRVYLELAVLRDVAARLRVRNVKPLADLAVLLLSEAGKRVSARKTAGQLGISQPTFRSFVQGLNDAFLILSVPPFLHSPRQRIVADAKHYAYDTGLQSSVSVSTSLDEGRRWENLVAIELVRRGYRVSYLPGEAECDFIAQKLGAQTLAIQVTTGEGGVPPREIEGLRHGMRQARAHGLLLTREKTSVDVPKNAVLLPLEEWLLQSLSV